MYSAYKGHIQNSFRNTGKAGDYPVLFIVKFCEVKSCICLIKNAKIT